MGELSFLNGIINHFGLNREIVIGVLGNIFYFLLLLIVGWLINFFLNPSKKRKSLGGVYDCVYYVPKKDNNSQSEKIKELIFIYKKFGSNKYYGFNINNPSNKDYRSFIKPIFRLEGEVHENRHFIGYWVHPDDNERDGYYGSFNIELTEKASQYSGLWNGKSVSRKKILSGVWKWNLRSEIKYSYLKLVIDRISSYSIISFFKCSTN